MSSVKRMLLFAVCMCAYFVGPQTVCWAYEYIGPPAEYRLLDKILEAQKRARERAEMFAGDIAGLDEIKKELLALKRIPRKKWTAKITKREHTLRTGTIPLLTQRIGALAEQTFVFLLNTATGEIREVMLAELPKPDGLQKPQSRKKKKETIDFPAYGDGCIVVKHGGGGHNPELLALCDSLVAPVLAFLHLHAEQTSRTRDVTHVYTPYSSQIHKPDIVTRGKEYLRQTIADAMNTLAQKRVPSRAAPGTFVHEAFSAEFVEALIINEHMDHAEFAEAANSPSSRAPSAQHALQFLIDKIFATIGANTDRAYIFSISRAGACCLVQFMPYTFAELRDAYPDAGLKSDFYASMRDHRTAIEMMILLFDRDRSEFTGKTKMLCEASREILEECVAVSYNGGRARLNAAIERYDEKWDEQKTVRPGRRTIGRGFTQETMTYLSKLRRIRELEN